MTKELIKIKSNVSVRDLISVPHRSDLKNAKGHVLVSFLDIEGVSKNNKDVKTGLADAVELYEILDLDSGSIDIYVYN